MHGKDNKKSLASKSQFQSKGFSKESVPFKATGHKGGISRQGSKRG
ncbi:integrase [Bifidobacterium pseudocatenulatum]|nr:integrase [Bifidobacterium pseudocatenulatum]MZN08789.1 integrase [Bifidobacterium pseudocatenulatum]MZO18395.1 integrase [Bifidobacterium pseudocatenulatum]RYT54584.1 integrase [Bifidobacterium pseudocatenulatum]